MSVAIGSHLASYEITALLGRGGMGEVFRGRDTKLKRDVAIKILPEIFSRDRERVNRFVREAELLAALNHPNIGSIYDIQEADGVRFLVLELVEGGTLAERIQRGPMHAEEAFQIARQICEALEAAHEKGIIHRDLKPANVKITAQGRVKVLDFGLAKALETAPNAASLSDSPTMSQATNAGVILGTASYMSPEQARATSADARSDVFSFGCVLYEMLTGGRAFQGETLSDVLASVLKSEPDYSGLPLRLHPRAKELLLRCLAKDPNGAGSPSRIFESKLKRFSRTQSGYLLRRFGASPSQRRCGNTRSSFWRVPRLQLWPSAFSARGPHAGQSHTILH